MPDIIAVTRDEIEHRFPCAPASFVLDAAEEAGLYLPSVCRHGRCGTCWATVVSGRYELAPFEEKAAPAAPGAVLLCRCRPREDMVVQLPCRDAQIGRRAVPERRAGVVAVTPLDKGWTALSLRLAREGEHGQAAEFSPGQFMELQPPGTALWQPLAMANLPNDEGLLEFLLPPAPHGAIGNNTPNGALSNTPDGALAGWLAGARGGAEVRLRGPLGRFTLDEASPRPRCLIGAGAGLVALLAMLRQLAALRDRTRLQVIFEAPKGGRLFAERMLAGPRAALPQLSIAVVPAAAAALQGLLEKRPEADIYACGPAAWLAAVADVARAHAVPEARLRTETLAGRTGEE